MRFAFDIRGTSGTYNVVFEKENNAVAISCSCPAGEKRQHCKHRIALLKGDCSAVISSNVSDAENLPALIKGTSLESALLGYLEMERVCDEAKKNLSASKKRLAREMFDL